MRYSIEPTLKLTKNLSNKYSQKLLDSGKKSRADAIRDASKKAIQKTAEAVDLIGNKIADEVTNISKYWTEINYQSRGVYNVYSDIRFKM